MNNYEFSEEEERTAGSYIVPPNPEIIVLTLKLNAMEAEWARVGLERSTQKSRCSREVLDLVFDI